jgi:hypothetical protein
MHLFLFLVWQQPLIGRLVVIFIHRIVVPAGDVNL